MISLKQFISAIHEAIITAGDTLMEKNIGLLDKYFEEKTSEEKDETGTIITKTNLTPKIVILEYPSVKSNGTEFVTEIKEVHVPLITLVPLRMSKIEKAVLTVDLDMEIEKGDIEVNFASKKHDGGLFRKSKKTSAKLEIIISPQESTDGLKLLVEGYESILKRQIT